MEFVKRSIEIIFSPLGILSILLAIGFGLSMTRKRSRAGHRLLIWGAVLFLIFFFSPLTQILIWNLEKQYPPMLAPPQMPKIEKIVILAGYAEENPGIPVTSNVSAQTLASMSEGLRLYRLVPNAKLIVSGGVVKKGDKAVAAVMAEFLQQMGVLKQDLIVEGNSHNTYENLREVRNLLGSAPFILVASGCDMRRAVAVALKLQMNPVPAPAFIWTLQKQARIESSPHKIAEFVKNWSYGSDNLSRLQWAYHEYVGYLWYCALGRI